MDTLVTWSKASGKRIEALRDQVKDLGAYEAWLADYRQRLATEQSNDAERAAGMNQVNPLYVLRNHLLQSCIEQAQRGDFAEIERLMRLVRSPFTEQRGQEAYASPPPEGTQISVSCSS